VALELEAKIRVDSRDAVRRRLRSLGARWVYEVLETNRIFDTPDQRLFHQGCGLRVRSCRGAGQVPAATLTYKGPPRAAALKSREELETHVGDPDQTGAILQAVGFKPVITFEKRREEWELDGLPVELDEVPGLGCFVEIEGPDEPSVNRIRERLDLADHPTIRESYVALLIDHVRQKGLSRDEIRFE